jgi:hypothetical protein
VSISENCRTEAKPVRWDYRDNPNRYRVHEIIAGLNALKLGHPETFNTTNYNWDVSGYGKRLQLNGPMNAVAVANFKVDGIEMIPGFQHTGQWWDYFSGESIEVTDINAFMAFEPGEYHVFVDQELNFPNTTDATETLKAIDESLAFPNPTANRMTWKFPVPLSDAFILSVFNHTGQAIGSGIQWQFSNDRTSIELDLGGVPTGIYHLQLTEANRIFKTQLAVERHR